MAFSEAGVLGDGEKLKIHPFEFLVKREVPSEGFVQHVADNPLVLNVFAKVFVEFGKLASEDGDAVD